jgi:Arc/MetJ family transcription regulator
MSRCNLYSQNPHCLNDVYTMRMSRVNITVPDDVAAKAREAGLNVSRVATTALIEELDRRAKIDALDAYLADLAAEFGPISPDEAAEATAWADRALKMARPAERKGRQTA